MQDNSNFEDQKSKFEDWALFHFKGGAHLSSDTKKSCWETWVMARHYALAEVLSMLSDEFDQINLMGGGSDYCQGRKNQVSRSAHLVQKMTSLGHLPTPKRFDRQGDHE